MARVTRKAAAKPSSLRSAIPGLRRTLRRFRPHLVEQRRLLATGAVALFAEVAMRLLEPWPLKFVLDGVVAAAGADLAVAQPASLQTVLVVACGAVVAVVALRAVASYVMTISFALAGNRVLTRVRGEVFAHLHGLSMGFHDKARTGDLVTRVTGDVGRLQEAMVTAALPLVGNVVTLLGMLTVIAVLDWQLALLVLAVFPFFALTSVRLTKSINTVSRQQRSADGAIASLATETLSSMKVVQSYSLEQQMQDQFGTSNRKSLRDGVRAKKLSAGLERTTDVLVGLATAVVLYVGAQRVLSGALTPGELVVFLTYLKTAFKPMRDVAKYTGRIAKAAASGERIVDVLEVEPDIVDAMGARRARPFRGHVQLVDVWLSYEPGHPVLRGLSMNVLPGERIGIVGPSGSGKSSVVTLLSRLRDPDQGVVRMDGRDLRTLTLDSVRRQVAVVLQDSVLFAASVRDNIAYGLTGATDADIEQAARLAGAHDFVRALPRGYDTVVGERGATLSGGQRQRIAIARAAIRQAPVVVLDEAMTGLDGETEAEVLAALGRLTQGRTTFVVTHDLAAAADTDRVFWVQDGALLDHGPAAEVLARQQHRMATDATSTRKGTRHVASR